MVTAKRKTGFENKIIMKEPLMVYTTEAWICFFGVALVRKGIYVILISESKFK